jgi:hypothetical protein
LKEGCYSVFVIAATAVEHVEHGFQLEHSKVLEVRFARGIGVHTVVGAKHFEGGDFLGVAALEESTCGACL